MISIVILLVFDPLRDQFSSYLCFHLSQSLFSLTHAELA